MSKARSPKRDLPDHEKWFLLGKTGKIGVPLKVQLDVMPNEYVPSYARGVLSRKRGWTRMIGQLSREQQAIANRYKATIEPETDSSKSMTSESEGSSGIDESSCDEGDVNCRGQPQSPMAAPNAYGRLKKGGIVKGRKGEPVHIIAHAGELVVPTNIVPQVLKSNAWIQHVKDIQQKHKISYKEAMVMAKGTYKK
jgi:hypothetical protein